MMRHQLEELVARLGPNPWVQSLLILVLSLAVAKLAEWVSANLLPRLTRRTETEIDDQFFEILQRPVSASFLLIGIHFSLLPLTIVEPFDRYLGSLLATMAVFVWLGFALRFSNLVLQTLSRKRDIFTFVQPQTLPVLENAATVLLVGGATYFLLLAWHVSVSGWLASAGIAGLAIGLAAKDTLANLFAGVSILADAPFTVGDFIILESGERGEIIRIGIRSSRLLTRDDLEIVLPNSILANSKIINEAGGPTRQRRVRVSVQVAYDSDIDLVRRVLLEVANSHSQVMTEPEPRVRFREFQDSGLRFELLTWVAEPVLRGRVLDALNSAVFQRFQAEGICFPYPSRDIYLHQVNEANSQGPT